MLNRPWWQAILDIEAGTPVEKVWETDGDVSEAIEGRWCGAKVPPRDACSYRQEDCIPCGGELLYRRRLEGEKIVSYLVCQFCGHRTPMLSCDTTTGEHTDLLAAKAVSP